MRDVRGVETSVSAAVARLRWRGRYAPRCRSGGASGGGRDENIALGSCLRCETADDVRRDVFLHGRRHMRLCILLRGCPAYAAVVRWESMVRDGAIFGVRRVPSGMLRGSVKAERGGRRAAFLCAECLPRAWRAPGEVGVSLGFAAY